MLQRRHGVILQQHRQNHRCDVAATPDIYDLRCRSDVAIQCRIDVAVRHHGAISQRRRDTTVLRLIYYIHINLYLQVHIKNYLL